MRLRRSYRSMRIALVAAAFGTSSCVAATLSPVASPRASEPASSSPTTNVRPATRCADRVFDGLSVPERTGQLFAVGLAGDAFGPAERRAVRTRHIGSVWFTETTREGVAAVRAVSSAVQAETSATGGVGFFVAANQEGGQIQALRGPGFSRIPPATTQGTLDVVTLERDATMWGGQLLEAGVNLDFAPVLDVVPRGTEATNAPIGALQRGFGSDPASVAAHGAAFIRGMAEAGVATTAKHYPGLGRVRTNTDFGAGVVDATTTSTDPYLEPFVSAATAGVPIVMVSLARYTRIDPDQIAAFSPTVLGLLRRAAHFGGVVASDSLTATAVAGIPPGARAVAFVRAGGNMVIARSVDAIDAMVDAVAARAARDVTFRARVDDSARRILAAKERAGLLDGLCQ